MRPIGFGAMHNSRLLPRSVLSGITSLLRLSLNRSRPGQRGLAGVFVGARQSSYNLDCLLRGSLRHASVRLLLQFRPPETVRLLGFAEKRFIVF